MADARYPPGSSTDGRDRIRLGSGLLVLTGAVLAVDVGGPYSLEFLLGSVAVAVLATVGDARTAATGGWIGGAVGMALLVSIARPGLLTSVPCLLGSLLLISGAGRILVSPVVDPSSRLQRLAFAGAVAVVIAQVVGVDLGWFSLGFRVDAWGGPYPKANGRLLFLVVGLAAPYVFGRAWGWTGAHLAIALAAWVPVGAVTGAFTDEPSGPIPGGTSTASLVVDLVQVATPVLFLAGLGAVSLAGVLEIRRELRGSVRTESDYLGHASSGPD